MLKEKQDGWVRVLAIGDVVGRVGRKFLRKSLPMLREAYEPDAVIVNVENAAGGFGMTRDVYHEFEDMGIDCMTSGNHIFDKKGYDDWMPWAVSLLRPENFPPGTVGKGYTVIPLAGDVKLGVLNLMGRTFMKPYDCPFRAAAEIVPKLKGETPLIVVDFHAEATSEKIAMGWYLSRKVSAVWGTHTHVPTADGRILEEFTGYLTDLGMVGPLNSVIGMKKEPIIEGFLTLGRTRFEVAGGDCYLGGCLFDLDRENGRCAQLEPLYLTADHLLEINAPG